MHLASQNRQLTCDAEGLVAELLNARGADNFGTVRRGVLLVKGVVVFQVESLDSGKAEGFGVVNASGAAVGRPYTTRKGARQDLYQPAATSYNGPVAG